MAKPFTVPRGFALVPIQPTEAMLDAIAGTPWGSLSPSKQAAEFAAWRQILKAAERAVDANGVALDASNKPNGGA
jgi:hypothetical protein